MKKSTKLKAIPPWTLSVSLILLLLHWLANSCHGFVSPTTPTTRRKARILGDSRLILHKDAMTGLFLSKGFGKGNDNEKSVGDKIRTSTGIRPSLHPIVINAVADALKQRSLKELGKGQADMHFKIDPSNNIAPIDIALTAGTFSAKALGQRQENDDEKLTEKEEQTIAGRIMGIIMRMEDLEDALQEKVESVSWIADYGEWTTFGVLERESLEEIHQSIVDDPLLTLNRAECLLGIFLKEVEIPQLQKVKESVPDKSKIDFLDADRMEALGLD